MANVSKEVLDRQPTAILGKAIQKAIDGGWQKDDEYGIREVISVEYFPKSKSLNIHCMGGKSGTIPSIKCTQLVNVIFSHDFAKALWPPYTYEEMLSERARFTLIDSLAKVQDRWVGHLKEMVVAEDPIRYLGEHI